MRVGRVLPFVFVLAGAVFACEAIVGIEDRRFVVPDPPPPPPDPCVRADPPPRPNAPDMTELDGPSYAFALSWLDVTGKNEDGTLTGYDLDRSCTCNTSPNTAYDGAPSCEPLEDPARQCDSDGGVDNALGRLVDEYAAVLQLNQDFLRPLRCGESSVLILLTKYNGLANDPDVTIQTVETRGIRTPPTGYTEEKAREAGCTPDPNDLTYPPANDGNDRWTVPRSRLVPQANGVSATTAFFNGWVNDYRLVIDDSGDDRLTFVVFNRVVDVSRPRFEAKLVPLDADLKELPLDADGNAIRVDGVVPRFAIRTGTLAGRARRDDVVSAMGAVRVDGKKRLCDDVQLFGIAKQVICPASDVKISPRADFQPGPCDALSLGFRFAATPAIVESYDEPTTSPSDDCGLVPQSCP